MAKYFVNIKYGGKAVDGVELAGLPLEAIRVIRLAQKNESRDQFIWPVKDGSWFGNRREPDGQPLVPVGVRWWEYTVQPLHVESADMHKQGGVASSSGLQSAMQGAGLFRGTLRILIADEQKGRYSYWYSGDHYRSAQLVCVDEKTPVDQSTTQETLDGIAYKVHMA